MSRSSNARRPYVRQSKAITRRASQDLLSRAGQAPIERPRVEQLEPRKMLFSLTIDGDSPTDAAGNRYEEAFFAYFLPYFLSPNEVQDDDDDNNTEENFNGEDPQNVNGQLALDSGILIQNGFPDPFQSLRIVAAQDVGGQPLGDFTVLEVLTGGAGDNFSLITLADSDAPNGLRNVSTSAQIDILNATGSPVGTNVTTNGNGILDGAVIVQTLFQGEVQRTYDQTDLQNLLGVDGVGRLNLDAAGGSVGVFDEIRFIQTADAFSAPGIEAANFLIDNMTFVPPPMQFADIVDARKWGGYIRITGPEGASVQVLDLYGRDMQETLQIGRPEDGNFIFGDFNGDGIPEYNDGIGQVILTGFGDGTGSSLTMTGGVMESFDGTVPDGTLASGGGFAWTVGGDYDLIEELEDTAGLGFFQLPDGELGAMGLPNGSARLVIGSAYNRPLSDYRPGETPSGTTFNDPNQGIFLLDGSSIGDVNTSAVLFGSSRFNGSVGTLSVGVNYGNVSVEGDLDAFVVASDAGVIVQDIDGIDDDLGTVPVFTTNAELIVGRTLREFVVGGRNLMSVIVDGDVSSSAIEPNEVLVYNEREVIFGFNPDTELVVYVNSVINGTVPTEDFINSFITTGADVVRPVLFGRSIYRNDHFLSAEIVNSAATAVFLRGETGGQDTQNSGEDFTDVYGIAVDGTRDIIIEAFPTSGGTPLIRILDAEGKTVAANSLEIDNAFGSVFSYTPDAPGIYYVAVGQDPSTGDPGINQSYSILVSGLAPTTLGGYRSALGAGVDRDIRTLADDNELERPVVVTNSGNIGSVRVGTGYIDEDGSYIVDFNLVNSLEENENDAARMAGFSLSTPGDLYNISTGGDVGSAGGRAGSPNDFTVGRDFGSLYTGLSSVIGTSYLHGDLADFTLITGGRVGLIKVSGAIGASQDDAADGGGVSTLPLETVVIQTGTDDDLRGDIGLIYVGSGVAGDTLTIDTSATNGSVVGGLLISQDAPDYGRDASVLFNDRGIFGGFNAIDLNLGQDSDIRFVDIPYIDLRGAADTFLPIITGETLRLVDDAGGIVEIEVTSREINPIVIGRVYVVPVEGSEGVAIARIEIDDLSGTGVFTGGRTLTISGQGGQSVQDIISIGRIVIDGADEFSDIVIEGSAQIDVYRIDAPAGIRTIEQDTPEGDIVAIDTQTITNLRIEDGNLGKTQVPVWGPQWIGPELGINGSNGEFNSEQSFTLNEAYIILGAAGEIFRPTDASQDATPYLDDVGGPYDIYLNGLRVREGGVNEVLVGGAVGDVIVEEDGAEILRVVANEDGVTDEGDFDGIIGTIFSGGDIVEIEIGDGLVTATDSPLARAGIFAQGAIGSITDNVANADIRGVINAIADPTLTGLNTTFLGIEEIRLDGGGSIVDAYIATSSTHDFFWNGVLFTETVTFIGSMDEIVVRNGDIFRSEITTNFLDTLTITGGFYDATELNVLGSVTNAISADGYRNSTLGGDVLEFRLSRILVGEDLENLRTTAMGDFVDTTLTVTGDVNGAITARNFIRGTIGIANTLNRMTATDSVLASTITAGQLVALNVTDDIRTSAINVGGPLQTITVGDSVDRTTITASGPDGRIGTISVVNTLDADITSSGRVGTIQSTMGDIRGSVTTTTERGNITLISAFRDLAIETDIGGDLASLIAGRNIGDRNNPGVILVRGDAGTLDVSGGRLYSDLRVGGTITLITLGNVSNLPTAPKGDDGDIEAFGRIQAINITGDYDGEIISESGGIGTITITDGSMLPEAAIIARDGGIGSIIIVAGHLMGDIFADQTIGTIRVEASADGVFGDVGINPALSAGVATDDAGRNQLPPDVVATSAIDGPVIYSLRGINNFIVTGGSIFDATIYAGTNLGLLDVTGNIQSDNQQSDDASVTIAAGDQIQEVNVTGGVSDTLFIVGVESFGNSPMFNVLDPLYNDRPGGTGAETDVIKAGWIREVNIGGNATDVTFSAGMVAGADGIYGTGDEAIVLGFSYVDEINIGGTRTNVTVSADRKFYVLNGQVITPAIQDATPSLNNAGRNAPSFEGLIESLSGAFSGGMIDLGLIGTVVDFGTVETFTWNGTTFTVEALSTEAGAANSDASRGIVWDAARGRLILANTRLADGVIVSVVDNDNNPDTPLPELVDFDIVSNDEASIGLIQVNGNLRGGSDIIVDNYARVIDIDDYEGTGRIAVGMDMVTLNVGRFAGGSISANFVDSVNFTKSLVVFNGNIPFVDLTGVRSFNVEQNLTATVNVDRSVKEIFNVGGVIAQSFIRAGGSITAFTADEIDRARISVANTLGSVVIAGDVFDASIIAGGDLGSDAQIGRSATDSTTADRTTSGTIGSVVIGGDFFESDIVAGFLRGPDGFFGTDDDTAASGISTIGNVTIAGDGTGSNVNSESYTIAAAGTLAFVTIGGDEGQSAGNFTIDPFSGEPVPIQVTNLLVRQDARSYTIEFSFNQEIDTSTFLDALTIREVVSEGNFITLTPPTPGDPGSGDYSVVYDIPNRMVFVTVSRTVTERDLIDNGDGTFSRPADAGPGVYRISLDADILRARVSQARLDGDGDGFAEPGDDFSVDNIIGDAGDVGGPRDPVTVDVNGDGSLLVDLYGPTSLDQVLDSNSNPDGVPDINEPFTIRGALGDHPDRDINDFSFGSDIDVYEISLQAGQILQLGEISGPAFQAVRSVFYQPTGGADPVLVNTQQGSSFNNLFFVTGFGAFETQYAVPLPIEPSDLTDRSEGAALLIKESGTFYIVLESGEGPSNVWYTPGAVKDTDVEPNQIGNYQFTVEVFDDGNSGFSAGNDAGDGTNIVHAPPLTLFTDPSDRVVIGDYTFRRTAGGDGVFGNNDDTVTGSTADGELTSTRSGTRLTNLIDSSLGDPGVTGVPGDSVESDVDIWHLNNRQPIAPGTRMTITVQLADVGGDLGSTLTRDATTFTSLGDFQDFTKNVQFGLFDTTDSSNVDDGLLVFSPTDFEPRSSTPNTIIAQSSSTTYGYDENGDFYISFVVPPALNGSASDSGTFAVYIQGAFQSDYQMEIITQGTGSQLIRSQNVLIETAGGVIDWLTVEGSPVELGAFDARSLGFTGRVNNIDINTYILNELVRDLNAVYQNAGFDVTFSTNPADFEFEEFSTVFLTSDNDPTGLIVLSDYGYSEHSDPFNTDLEDEAVVFSPDFSLLGYSPSTADLDSFIESLTASTGRRVGELVGLRLTDPGFSPVDDIDIFASSSVQFTPIGGEYVIPDDARSLASHLNFLDETGFYLGQQDSASLLDRILAN